MIAAVTAASAVSGAIPVGRLRGLGAAAFVALPAAIAGATCWAALKTKDDPQRAFTTGVSTVAIAAGQTLNIAIDRLFEGALVRRGVQHPRLVLAALNGVIGGATWTLSPPKTTVP